MIGRFTLEWHKAVNCTLVFGDVALGGEEAVALIVRILQAQRWRRDSALQRARRAARSMSSAGALPEDRRVPRIDVAGLETALTNDLGCGPSATAPRRDSAHTRSCHHSGAGSCGASSSQWPLAVLMSPAISADKQALLYKAPVPAASAGNWTGCYVGGQADGLWGQSTKWIVRTQGGAFANQSLGGHEVDSWGGGAQAGCDFQFAGGYVAGLQGDYAAMGGGGSLPARMRSAFPITATWNRCHRSPVASATPGVASSPIREVAPPGSATNIRPRRSCSALPTRRTRRGRAGQSASAVNMPSPTFSPVTSAPTGFLSIHKSPDCLRHLLMSKRPEASCAPVLTSVSGVTRRRSLSGTEPGFQFTELTTAERSSYFESRRSPHAA
jgi:hypothetical protein